MKSVYWIRRDFRVDDNPALHQALLHGAKTAIYHVTPATWREHHKASIQIDFIERHLNRFSQQLARLGMEVEVIQLDTFADQVTHLRDYCTDHGIDTIYANTEPEIDEIARDNAVAKFVRLVTFESDVILPRGSVLNQQQQMYKVFTPFRNAWLRAFYSAFQPPKATKIDALDSNANHRNIEFNIESSSSSAWPLSEVIQAKVLPDFVEQKWRNYAVDRDIPGIKGTSGISPYLAIGAISPRRIVYDLLQHAPNLIDKPSDPRFVWLNELIWRDFYRHLLHFFPNICYLHDFQPKFKGFIWANDDTLFDKWCSAKTGFPIIDAAIRQLLATGWMHNRLRMIVASFLTKHLLLDWRKGERFFMQHLIDGDFASNNGGWQWAAGTGCDAQPYFRIFNPVSQSKKFDPEGKFIRKYLPELENVPDKHIHFPHTYLSSGVVENNYWEPITDLKVARTRALHHYKVQLEKAT